MEEQKSHEFDAVGFHYEELRTLLTRVNNPKQYSSEFNTEISDHFKQINGVTGTNISFCFRQRMIPDWDRERSFDKYRQLDYYRIEENEVEFGGKIPLTSIRRKLEGIEVRPVKLGRAVAYFFSPETESSFNAILSSPRRYMELPIVPDMTLYQSLL
jgi:hypothetical protein